MLFKKLLLKISDNCQENTNTGKDKLKLQACNYIYQKGQPGTGVFLRMLRNIRTPSKKRMKNLAGHYSEAAVHRFSSKYVFFKISQYSQKNTCVGISF